MFIKVFVFYRPDIINMSQTKMYYILKVCQVTRGFVQNKVKLLNIVTSLE